MTETNERLKTSVNDLSAVPPGDRGRALAPRRPRANTSASWASTPERVKIKGFRPGMAPRDMVQQMFDHEIRHSVVDSLIPKVLEEILAARDIHPVGVPSVERRPLRRGRAAQVQGHRRDLAGIRAAVL